MARIMERRTPSFSRIKVAPMTDTPTDSINAVARYPTSDSSIPVSREITVTSGDTSEKETIITIWLTQIMRPITKRYLDGAFFTCSSIVFSPIVAVHTAKRARQCSLTRFAACLFRLERHRPGLSVRFKGHTDLSGGNGAYHGQEPPLEGVVLRCGKILQRARVSVADAL